MTAKKMRKKPTTTANDGVIDAHRRVDGGTETNPIIVHENYVIEGNCRVACIRMIVVQINKSQRRPARRATAHGRGDVAGPAPPAAPGA